MEKRRSLESFFKSQTRRWSLLGFGLTLLAAIPCLFYAEKMASERQLVTVARAGATAFRPLILEGNIRDAQIQIREALALQPDESAVVRDANLALIYSTDPSVATAPLCSAHGAFCWSPQFRSVTTLYPIYFDEPERKSLFGYLEVTLRPALDYSILWFLFILILTAFVGQAIGMSNALSRANSKLTKLFDQWSEHLKESPASSLPKDAETPFVEMSGLEKSVGSLHIKIQRLQAEAAKEAKASAHFSLLREIGHDLRTPHSQLAKNFALLVDTVKTTQSLDPKEVTKVEGSLKRMGDLIRQVRTLTVGQKPSDSPASVYLSMQNETEAIIEDLRDDPEVVENNIRIDFESTDSIPMALITKLEFYRVVENLVRNAVAAAAGKPDAVIKVNILSEKGRPTLLVGDNGCGIPADIQDRVFDFNFTTRPARGTGLGLGIVKHICDQYGATVRFRSEVGKGTEFQVSFSPSVKNTFPTYEENQEATYVQV